MPKGFVTLTRSGSNPREHRIAVGNIADYVRSHDDKFTHITLHSRSEGDNETVNVVETEDEIDDLINVANGETQRSEFAEAMGHALLGGAR